MPPRWAVFAIVVFWLNATGWLIQRDMWPTWFPPPHEPPPFDIDMTDEFGTNHTEWQVFVDGEYAGTGGSEVAPGGDGALDFKTELRFQKKPIFGFCTYLGSTNRITTKGELKSMSFTVKMKFNPKDSELKIDLEAQIEDGFLKPKLTIFDSTMLSEPIPVPENGIVFNPAFLGTRIRQLRNGQTWRVPTLDIGAVAARKGKEMFGKELHAEVSEEVIQWAGQDVLCFKIEFRPPGKEVTATTWVRHRDGQVLKQQAKPADFMDVDLLLVRSHSN